MKAMEVGGKLTVRSALNPILWLCAEVLHRHDVVTASTILHLQQIPSSTITHTSVEVFHQHQITNEWIPLREHDVAAVR